MEDNKSLISLYISNLDESVNEGTLFEVFKTFGTVASFRVVKDENGKSLGYAYVNFNDEAEAERAIKELNGTQINGKACSISHQKRRSGKNTIFVSNLSEGTSNEDLTAVFSQFGSITSVKVVPSHSGNIQGYVEFETEDEMNAALEAADSISIDGKSLYVTQFIPRDKREKLKETSWTNIFVKNLPGSMTLTELNELFEPYGAIQGSVVKPIDIEGETKCYGYVNFEKHEDAVKAVNELNESIYEDSPIYCSRAEKKTDRKKRGKFNGDSNKFYGRNLFVKNIDFFFTEEDLILEFSKYGNVTSCKIAKDEIGSKGFGYICFETEDQARMAIQDKMVNRYMVGGTKPLFVTLHEPKDMRHERLSRGDISFMNAQDYAPYNPYALPGMYAAPPPQPTPQTELMAVVQSLQPRQLQESPKDQLRQTIGNIIYPLIQQYQPTYATKIVGMFLDWPTHQIYEVFMNPELFNEALHSATQLLNQQVQNQQQQ